MRKEQYEVPQVQFVFRENSEFVNRTSAELFNGKRVVIFSLPGACTASRSESTRQAKNDHTLSTE